MTTKILSALLLSAVASLGAANLYAASDATQPIVNLFDAMREHDAAKLTAQFTDNALLQRARPDDTISTTPIAKFAQMVGQSDKHLDEHLLSIDVQQSDNLATVFTPFAFYLDGKLSHCGVNSFQLVHTASGWKIHYLIDNAHQGDCEAFIKQHRDNKEASGLGE